MAKRRRVEVKTETHEEVVGFWKDAKKNERQYYLSSKLD